MTTLPGSVGLMFVRYEGIMCGRSRKWISITPKFPQLEFPATWNPRNVTARIGISDSNALPL